MTREQIIARFPHASEAFIKANISGDYSIPNQKPEQPVRNDPVGEAPGKEEGAGNFLVRIKSFRVRLLDKDNLYGGAKYLVDVLRYASIIPSDAPDKIDLEITQTKVQTEQDENTLIEVLKISTKNHLT